MSTESEAEFTEVVEVRASDDGHVVEIVDVVIDDEGEVVEMAEVVLVDGVAEEILVLEEIDTTPTLPVWEPTGDPAVDAALDELASLDLHDRSEHIQIFESVHRQLHQRLSDLSSGS